MDPLLPWFAIAAAVTVVNGSIIGFISWREHNAALKLWAWAWFAWAGAIVPLIVAGMPEPAPLVGISCGVFWVASTLCFLAGNHAFAGRTLPKGWFFVATACIVVAVGLGVGPSGAVGMVPLVLFQCLGMLVAGVFLIRQTPHRAGAWLCGGSMVLLALHVATAPVASRHPWLMPWGFALAITLELLTALGMLMLYYEHARTQLLKAHRALEETRRVEALGRIASGVAHDFNNMLTVVQGTVELIRMRGMGEPKLEECLHSVDSALDQARRLTAQLLAFGRRDAPQARSVDARDIVEATVQLLSKAMPDGIRLRFACTEQHLITRVDRVLLEQIVLNLVTNARDAITKDGTIAVELEKMTTPRDGLLLRVQDDGHGMDATTRERIFEPFFTTKPSGRGTGLGLASVQSVVALLGGSVSVQSAVGSGTTFEVALPALPAGKPRSAAPPHTDAEKPRTPANVS